MSSDTTIQLENLVEQARGGNQQAFEALYQQTYSLVYFHAKSITKNEEEALDLVQDAYLAAYNGLNRLQDSRNFRKWITRIVFNLGCKKLRGAHEVLLGEDGEEEFEALPEQDEARLPEESLDRKETVKIVKEVIEGLPVLQKAAVIAYYMDEMGIVDIARLAQCSEGTIKSRLNYARKAMKERILQKEREMGCSLHVVTAPVIVLALRQMFMGTAVSPEKMALVWGLICPQFSVGAAAFASGVGSGVGSGAAGSGAAETAGAQAAAAQSAGQGTAQAGTAASGSAAQSGSAAASAAVKGGTAVAKLKLITGAAAAVTVVSVGVAGAGYVSYRQGQTAVVTETAATEASVAEEEGQRCILAEIEGQREIAAEGEAGWVEFDEGWKYRKADGTYLKEQWAEIDGELYYFYPDEWLCIDSFAYGKRFFDLTEAGNLMEISYDGGAVFYTGDIMYYSEPEIGVCAMDIWTGDAWNLCEHDAENIAVEEDWVYFTSPQTLYRMKTDGTQLEEWNEESWTYAYSMEISDGLIYMYMTDMPSEDGEVSTGWLCEANPQNRTFRELPIAFPAPPEYGQMQAEDGWLYFVADNPSPETFGGTEFSDVLLRASLEDYHVERISDENIEAFFVCGDTAFCMKDGEAVQYSISQCAEEISPHSP